jgi:hypothetical protein
MRMQSGHDIRAGERRQFQGEVRVSWQDRSGQMTTVRAKCTDLSDLGARIETESPIEFRTQVYLQAPAHGLMGTATVRYCRRSGLKHIVGLLFSSVASQADQGRKRLIRKQPGTEE